MRIAVSGLSLSASVFALMLGYSRIPYAAARDGLFFRAFAKLHRTRHFPHLSLLAFGLIVDLTGAGPCPSLCRLRSCF